MISNLPRETAVVPKPTVDSYLALLSLPGGWLLSKNLYVPIPAVVAANPIIFERTSKTGPSEVIAIFLALTETIPAEES